MKRLRYLLLLAALLTWTSCEKTPTDDPTPADPAPTDITLTPSSLSSFESGGAQFSLTVTSPSRPKLSVPDWMSFKDGTYDKYSITFAVTVSANTTYESRSGEITVTAGSLSKSLSVSQKGKEKPVIPETNIDKVPVTKGITDKGNALYSYLLSQYGSKLISSVVAEVNWNHREADKIFKATGKYPAVNCYDFIHIYVPENNWINYKDLTPVTEWADAGGIVSLMWHFNVPKTEATVPGADGSGVTCTPSETTFKASNALVDGTWENKWFYGQMDKVADIILSLQEKGIACLWRPFHEGAGNHYALKWKGTAWFWWGFDGPETYQKLWKAMFDYFYGKGIRNLIWIWTAQNYNGNSSEYGNDAAFYPGDSFVDLVARDLYGTMADANAQEFAELQSRYPNKMIVLGECGKNGTVAFSAVKDFWEAGAKWGYFMPWYGSNMPDDAWWKAALTQDFVITRDQLK